MLLRGFWGWIGWEWIESSLPRKARALKGIEAGKVPLFSFVALFLDQFVYTGREKMATEAKFTISMRGISAVYFLSQEGDQYFEVYVNALAPRYPAPRYRPRGELLTSSSAFKTSVTIILTFANPPFSPGLRHTHHHDSSHHHHHHHRRHDNGNDDPLIDPGALGTSLPSTCFPPATKHLLIIIITKPRPAFVIIIIIIIKLLE